MPRELAPPPAGAVRDLGPPPEAPGDMEQFATAAAHGAGQGFTLGFGDEINAAIQALGIKAAGQTGAEKTLGQLYKQNRDTFRREDAAAREANPKAYLGGEVVASLPATIATAGEAGVGTRLARLLRAGRVGATLGGVQGVGASEAPTAGGVATEGTVGAALGGVLGPVGEAVSEIPGAIGRRLLPRAQAFLGRAEQAIADRSAGGAEALAKSAQGTAGASRANASRTVERLGMKEALAPAEIAANEAALGTPEAQQLAQELAARARGELPERLAHMQATQALAQRTAADAAAARSPEAVRAMEKQMRTDATKRLLTRYILPGAAGYAVGELGGGHGTLGAAAGFGARPMLRATLRNLTSPAFQAPLGRVGVDVAEGLIGASGGEGAGRLATMAPAFRTRVNALVDALRGKRPVQVADAGRELE